MKKLSEQVRLKIRNGILLEGDEITELFDYNEEFFERKKQEALDYFNKYGGVERFAKAHEEWLKSNKATQ